MVRANTNMLSLHRCKEILLASDLKLKLGAWDWDRLLYPDLFVHILKLVQIVTVFSCVEGYQTSLRLHQDQVFQTETNLEVRNSEVIR